MRLGLVSALSAAIVLASCGTVSFQAISDVAVERLVNGLEPAPAPRGVIAFADTEEFDRVMWSSLRNATGPTGTVRVTVPAGTTDGPPRLMTWVSRAQVNQIKTCQVPGNESAGFGIYEIVLRFLYNMARSHKIYEPAEQFNVVVETNASTRQLVAMTFVSKQTDFDRYLLRYPGCA